MLRCLAVTAALLFVLGGVSSTPIGALPLDSVTFDKIVGRSLPVLVKFDKKYPYGEEEDEWKATVEEYGPKAGILLAEVGVTDYGDKENDDLRERYKVSTDDFPAFKLFPADGGEPVSFEGKVEKEALAAFIKETSGVWIGLSGCIEAFDIAAAKYVAASADERVKLLDETKEAAKELVGDDAKSAKAYIKTMERITSRGEDYPATETKRVQKLLESRLTDAKKKGFKQRINILSSFKSAGQKKEL